MSLLSIPGAPTKPLIEQACNRFLEIGVGTEGGGYVIIRSGGMGAYVATGGRVGEWIPAFWNSDDGHEHIVDVTGAGNSFLGGLAAGLLFTEGDVYKATFYATVSASFIIEQEGLPRLTHVTDGSRGMIEQWNEDSPVRRLEELQRRLQKVTK
ncbi:hypothetical protein AcW1_004546 [Taiwanofungus camphoratus]|nr:hypothetical protein AcW2_006448 [Antrodia cinnamomea]KAI0939547.1 hypothetical protein AcV5_000928 [Antrodia cinnamomea]KAI0959839.1 hypothetical protein AcW1_004546 [Antrodia cinnamomea]